MEAGYCVWTVVWTKSWTAEREPVPVRGCNELPTGAAAKKSRSASCTSPLLVFQVGNLPSVRRGPVGPFIVTGGVVTVVESKKDERDRRLVSLSQSSHSAGTTSSSSTGPRPSGVVETTGPLCIRHIVRWRFLVTSTWETLIAKALPSQAR